jgi:hypothetical protein
MKGLQSGCVDAMAVPPDSLLARFALYGGVLSTGEVARAGSIPFEVPFLDRDDLNNELKTYHQAVALWANWEARIPPNNHYEVGIRFTSFDTRKVRTLLLSYAGLPSGGSLWLSLKNVTLSDLLELSDAIEPNVVRESHFDLHYTIADMIPNPQWVPDLSRATDGKPLCPPAQLQVEV